MDRNVKGFGEPPDHSVNIRSESIPRETLVIVTHMEHPLADIGQIDMSHLRCRTVFLPKSRCGYGMSFRQILAVDIAEPRAVLELTSIETMKRCV